MQDTSERWINLRMAAAHLNVSESWLYQKGLKLGVPYSKIGSHYRFKASDLDTWMIEQALNNA